MKKILILATTVLLFASCSQKNKKQDKIEDNISQAVNVKFNPHSFLVTSKLLPKRIDLNMDISDMTMMELRLLRHYPYALRGVWFMEEDINQFFCQKTKWYEKRCYKYLEEHDYNALTDFNKVTLSKEENEFIKRIDKRIAELKKLQMTDVDGLKLANPAMTVNMFQMDDMGKPLLGHLAHHNFAIVPTNNEQLFNIYEQNEYTSMPNYITTDVFLQAYHMYFSYVLKSLEKNMFIPRIKALNEAMYHKALEIAKGTDDAEIKDLAEFNAAYFAVANGLLTGKQPDVPESYASKAGLEITNIFNEKATMSPMMGKNINFQYDLFKPRGHYTRSEESKRYFRSMMWLQTFTFCSEQKQAVKQATMMAYLLNHIDRSVAKEGLSVYKTLDFLMGEPDNVAIIDVAEHLASKNISSPDKITDAATLKDINARLSTLFKTRNRITSKIAEDGCENKVNFMPQRYMPDGYILSRMFDEKPNSKVAFPRGLHVFSAFGVDAADKINEEYYQDADNWKGYTNEMTKMKAKMAAFADWDKSMYNKWMECLVALQKPNKDYPDYMKTPSWKRKNLNTGLASWAELKHDAILYAEQPICAECGGGGEFPDPIRVGYVEPNLAFWQKMKEMLSLTSSLLNKNGLMSESLKSRTSTLDDYMDFCIKVSKKELDGKMLSEEEYSTIRHMGSSLEWFTLSVIDPDSNLGSWDEVKGADRSVALVADVFTRSVLGCQKGGILEEATGTADIIYVNVVINGKIFLTRGATFSYYEFVNPLDKRYTDEEWQKRLEKDDVPARPVWMQPLIINKKIKENEETFYSSGC
ncbi:MAG: DUF3160 domain-containing protein [Bacteroidaceae bacterium]|nr:DUF3160 domain-containing protein [Bacteroidaceae bacterium]